MSETRNDQTHATDPTDPPDPTDPDLERWEARRVRTTARYTSRVSTLLTERPELRGISPLADTVEESVRWAV